MTLAGTHSVGTCKMGPDSDNSAVVDNQLRYNMFVTGVSLGPYPYIVVSYFIGDENLFFEIGNRKKCINKCYTDLITALN